MLSASREPSARGGDCVTTLRIVGLFATAAVLFGGTFVAVKAGLEFFPPLLFVALRFDIGAVLLLAYAAFAMSREELRPTTVGDVAGIVATGLLVMGLTNAFLFIGQQYTTSGVAAIVFSLAPILAPLFAAALLTDEQLSTRGLLGMAFGLVGVVFVTDPVGGTVSSRGIVILFGGAVASAFGAVAIRWAEPTISSTARTVWGAPLAAITAHLLSLGAGESLSAVSITPTALVALLYVGIFSGAIAFVAFFALIDAAGAIQANLVFYAIPVVSTIGGWLLLGESISLVTLLGFAIILGGFLLIGSRTIIRLLRTQVLPRYRDTIGKLPWVSRDASEP